MELLNAEAHVLRASTQTELLHKIIELVERRSLLAVNFDYVAHSEEPEQATVVFE